MSWLNSIRIPVFYKHISQQTSQPGNSLNHTTHLLRLRALKVLLTTLARLSSKNLAAFITRLRSAVTRTVLRDSHDLATVGKLLTGLEGRRAAVIGAVAIFGLLPITAPATVHAVEVGGIHARRWCRWRGRGRGGGWGDRGWERRRWRWRSRQLSRGHCGHERDGNELELHFDGLIEEESEGLGEIVWENQLVL